MSQHPLYVVSDWDLHFETYESKRLAKACAWVAMPNKHDGRSYRRLTREGDAAALYGAWAALVQVASKCPVRGTLADLDGPLDAVDLEDKTGFPAELFDRLFAVALTERIGWLTQITDADRIAAVIAEIRDKKSGNARKSPQTPADSRRLPQVPARSRRFPQISPNARRFPQESTIPRTFPQTPARLRAIPHLTGARGQTGPDRTGQYRTVPFSLPHERVLEQQIRRTPTEDVDLENLPLCPRS